MLKLIRGFLTIVGVGLLFCAFTADGWSSFGERFYCGMIGLLMVVFCNPSKVFRGVLQVCNILASIIDRDDNPPSKNTSRMAEPSQYSDPPNYGKPTPISRGNIEIITPAEMNIFMRYYREVDVIKTKVRGVSFRNDDGTDRQNILAHCHAGDQLRFHLYEYQGAPAYAVYCDWGQIGNLSAELAEELAARNSPCIILGEILNVSGGYHGSYFGCNICIRIYEKG